MLDLDVANISNVANDDVDAAPDQSSAEAVQSVTENRSIRTVHRPFRPHTVVS
jgi:hypothetical protein